MPRGPFLACGARTRVLRRGASLPCGFYRGRGGARLQARSRAPGGEMRAAGPPVARGVGPSCARWRVMARHGVTVRYPVPGRAYGRFKAGPARHGEEPAGGAVLPSLPACARRRGTDGGPAAPGRSSRRGGPIRRLQKMTVGHVTNLVTNAPNLLYRGVYTRVHALYISIKNFSSESVTL